jgi:hypothetical protein
VNTNVAAGAILVGALAVVATPIALLATNYYDDTTKVCTVTDKNRNVAYDRDGNREVQMLVYTEQCGTFEVGDSLIKGKFRSGDTFGKLKNGGTYKITYHGWRNGFLSMFPTITDVQEAN